jgi:hypothetical protein
VNDPADMRRLAELDAICTDRPDLLSSIVGPHAIGGGKDFPC